MTNGNIAYRMRKLFHFESSSSPYIADAAVLCCFDHRMQLVTRKFLKREGILQPDWIVVAGGAKTLASPRNDFEQDFILEQIRMSIRLHQARRVILTCHSDCATYGGLAAYNGDRQAEAEHHLQELARAAALVRAAFPNVEVVTHFIDFEGVWTVDKQQSSLPAAD
jgi:carbonic anhydrase